MVNPNCCNVCEGDTAIIDLNGKITKFPIVDVIPYFMIAHLGGKTMALSYEESIVCKQKTDQILIGSGVLERLANGSFGGLRLLR